MTSDFPKLFSDDEIEVPSSEVLHSGISIPKTDLEKQREAYQILSALYPRIYERIVSIWGSKELYDYFNALLISDREGREGFPPAVAHALMVLSRLHAKIYRFEEKADNWHQSKK